jgi:hypothetical protein
VTPKTPPRKKSKPAKKEESKTDKDSTPPDTVPSSFPPAFITPIAAHRGGANMLDPIDLLDSDSSSTTSIGDTNVLRNVVRSNEFSDMSEAEEEVVLPNTEDFYHRCRSSKQAQEDFNSDNGSGSGSGSDSGSDSNDDHDDGSKTLV